MNIFHKLDIHYPGTDIRAAAQGSWLGGGGPLSPSSPHSPAAKGHRALEGALCDPHLWGVLRGSQPHLSSACELIPTDLEAAASPSSPRSC